MPQPPAPAGVPLLEQVGRRLRFLHYSIRTEGAYLRIIQRLILFHGKRHPSEMGAEGIRHTSLCEAAVGVKLFVPSMPAESGHTDTAQRVLFISLFALLCGRFF